MHGFKSQVIHILEILDLAGVGGQACEQIGGYQDNIKIIIHKLSP